MEKETELKALNESLVISENDTRVQENSEELMN